MQNDCFPETYAEWRKGPVSELARVNPRYVVRKDDEYPFVPMAAVAEDFGGIEYFERRPANASGLARFKVSDTLFAKITPCPENGKIALVRTMPDQTGLGSTEFIVIAPKATTDSRFLFHLLCAHSFRGRAVARMEGSTGRQRVPEDVFTKRLLVPLPPLTEQEAIGEVLGAVEDSINAVREQIDAARALRSSLLAELLAFGIDEHGGVRDPNTGAFEHTAIGAIPEAWDPSNVATEFTIQTGITLNEEARRHHNKHPYLRVANARRYEVDLSDVQTLGASDEELAERRLETNDLLVVEGHADRRQIGRCALVPPDAVGLTFQNHLFRLRTKGKLNPRFAVLWLNSDYAQRYWDARCGTSSGLNTINQRALRLMAVPVPSPTEQAAIAKLADTQRDHLQSLVAHAAALRELRSAVAEDLLSGRVRLGNAHAAAAL